MHMRGVESARTRHPATDQNNNKLVCINLSRLVIHSGNLKRPILTYRDALRIVCCLTGTAIVRSVHGF